MRAVLERSGFTDDCLEIFLGVVFAHQFGDFDTVGPHRPAGGHLVEELICIRVVPDVVDDRAEADFVIPAGAANGVHKLGVNDIANIISWVIIVGFIGGQVIKLGECGLTTGPIIDPVVELDQLEGLQEVFPVRVRCFVTKHKLSFLFKGRSALVLCLPNLIDFIIAYSLDFVQWGLMSVV